MSMTVEALDFDPYRLWLNVSAPQRPVGPYQLLGLSPLEADTNRIRAGYLRQQSAMLLQVEKADPVVWESISREIEEAYSLLCDFEQKAVLDAGIRRKQGGANGKPAAGPLPGTTVSCRHCHRTSPANRRFCGGCGKSLWETCPQCHAENAADEQFCGSCGADILGELSEQSRQFQAKLDEAQELLRNSKFDAAVSCLRGVATISDPRFDKWAQQALAAIERVEHEQAAQKLAGMETLARAQKQFAAHAYEAAISELESIPATVRSADANTLLQQATSARQELLTLGGEIRAAIEEKRTADLLPKIQRLLTLKPNHAQAIQIAEQLRDGLVKQAKRYFTAHRYQECIDQLEQIPSFVRNPEVETIHETASELLALLDAVRNAALADRPTLGLANRLVKLAAANPEAAKARASLSSGRRPGLPIRAWGVPNHQPAPKRSTLGPPIDWLAYSTRIPAADERVAATLAEHPGQFHVALGLAIQGLGQAAVPLDLAPQENNTLAQMFPTFTHRAASAAWGIDLSDFAVKAVKLAKDSKDGSIKVAAAEYILHWAPLTNAEVELARPEIIDQALRDFLTRAGDLKGTKVVASITGQRVLGRFFELPPLAARKVADAIAYEAKHQLPVALDELCWTSDTLDPVDARSADAQLRRIMVCAARQSHVRDRLAAFKAAGIVVDHLQCDCVALHNAIVYELWSGEREPGDAAVCLVDVGGAMFECGDQFAPLRLVSHVRPGRGELHQHARQAIQPDVPAGRTNHARAGEGPAVRAGPRGARTDLCADRRRARAIAGELRQALSRSSGRAASLAWAAAFRPMACFDICAAGGRRLGELRFAKSAVRCAIGEHQGSSLHPFLFNASLSGASAGSRAVERGFKESSAMSTTTAPKPAVSKSPAPNFPAPSSPVPSSAVPSSRAPESKVQESKVPESLRLKTMTPNVIQDVGEVPLVLYSDVRDAAGQLELSAPLAGAGRAGDDRLQRRGGGAAGRRGDRLSRGATVRPRRVAGLSIPQRARRRPGVPRDRAHRVERHPGRCQRRDGGRRHDGQRPQRLQPRSRRPVAAAGKLLKDNTQPVWFCGHSLGGAMATICAYRCKTSSISSEPAGAAHVWLAARRLQAVHSPRRGEALPLGAQQRRRDARAAGVDGLSPLRQRGLPGPLRPDSQADRHLAEPRPLARPDCGFVPVEARPAWRTTA